MENYIRKKESHFLASISIVNDKNTNDQKAITKAIEFKILYWLLSITVAFALGFLIYVNFTCPLILLNICTELNYVPEELYTVANYVLPLSSVIGTMIFNYSFANYIDYSFGGFLLSLFAGIICQIVILAALILIYLIIVAIMYILAFCMVVAAIGFFGGIFE